MLKIEHWHLQRQRVSLRPPHPSMKSRKIYISREEDVGGMCNADTMGLCWQHIYVLTICFPVL